MAVTAMKPKNAVESLRDIVQDLLVPELKALKVEMEALRTEVRSGDDALRVEMKLRDENQTRAINSLAEEVRIRGEQQADATQALRIETGLRFEQQAEGLQALRTEMSLRFEHLDGRLGTLLEVRERLAVLEDRAKHS